MSPINSQQKSSLQNESVKNDIESESPLRETGGNARTVRKRPPMFRALGDNEPPEQVTVGGEVFDREEIFKHDSWAATAVYANSDSRIVCKFNRQQAIGPIPMGWLGRVLARRESILLTKLADLVNVPDNSGPVEANGKVLRNTVAHIFVPGQPLQHKNTLPLEFFEELKQTLECVHEKEIAYVDLHKRENILVGENGKPYLIDFQIGFWLPSWQPARLLSGWWLRMLQKSDSYHLFKHINKCGPQECAAEVDRHRPWFIKLHRRIAVPIRSLRRRLLVALKIRSGEGKAISETNPEIGHRKAA